MTSNEIKLQDEVNTQLPGTRSLFIYYLLIYQYL